MLNPILKKNDRLAKQLIGVLSLVVFAAVVLLSRVQLKVDLGFDVHIFATINAAINSMVSVLLVLALIAVKRRQFKLHKQLMLTAMVLSALFLVSYIAHHLLAGDTRFGGTGWVRGVYFFILITHIFLAAIILPFILLTAYRAAIAEWPQHQKLARITWPIWFYVSVTGVIVYWMISPYYNTL
jgi:putative membrane protein